MAITSPAQPKKAPTFKKGFAFGLAFIVVGVAIGVFGVVAYRAPPSATCNGQAMSPGDTCQVLGGSNPGTFGYDEMLARSKGTVGSLVVILFLGGLFVLAGGASVYSQLRRRQRAPA